MHLIQNKKLTSLLILFLPLSFIWCIKLPTILTGVLVFLALIKALKRKNLKWNFDCFIFITPILLALFGLINSSNLYEGIQYLERQSSFLIFPFVFVTYNNLSKKKINTIFTLFSINVVVFLIYNYIQFHIEGVNNSNFNQYLISLEKHPTYYGMYLNFSFIFCLNQIFNNSKSRFLYFFLTITISTLLFLISSKINWSIHAVLIFTTILYKTNSYLYKLCYSAIIIILVFTTYKYNYRFNQSFDNVHKYITQAYNKKDKLFIYRSDLIRLKLWDYGLELFKDKPLYGHGTGDLNQVFKQKLEDNNEINRIIDFNIHNQFIDYLARYGMFGLLLFLYFVFFFYHSFKEKNILLFSLIFIVFCCCLTENILQRQHGVMFFAYFNSIIFFNRNKLKANEQV